MDRQDQKKITEALAGWMCGRITDWTRENEFIRESLEDRLSSAIHRFMNPSKYEDYFREPTKRGVSDLIFSRIPDEATHPLSDLQSRYETEDRRDRALRHAAENFEVLAEEFGEGTTTGPHFAAGMRECAAKCRAAMNVPLRERAVIGDGARAYEPLSDVELEEYRAQAIIADREARFTSIIPGCLLSLLNEVAAWRRSGPDALALSAIEEIVETGKQELEPIDLAKLEPLQDLPDGMRERMLEHIAAHPKQFVQESAAQTLSDQQLREKIAQLEADTAREKLTQALSQSGKDERLPQATRYEPEED